MYEQFYKLRGRPFQLNPDPAFFFGSRGHKRALAYLQYGVNQNEGFIVITGEIGAGKTTLVRSLIEGLDPRQFVAAQLVSTQLAAGDLLRAVAIAYGIRCKVREKAQLLGSIEAFLTALSIDNRRALLVVDEAQNLSPRAIEELRMLSNFQLGTRPLLQSFLVGQPQLRAIMQRPELEQLRQRVLASYHLGPLDPGETNAYITHRLTHVGWNKDPDLDAAALAAIHGITGGIPRKINLLCDRLLLAGFLANKHSLGSADVEAVSTELIEELGDDQSAAASTPADEGKARAAEAATGHALRLAEISGRLDRIERTMSAALEILRKREKAMELSPVGK
ncbi:MAG: XrtA-associated ATPase [Burkholderiales bacterium]|nr:XrtA-associated ATPase [Burkholderiales bacterium]